MWRFEMDLTGPLDAHALADAKITLAHAPDLDDTGILDHIYLHWSVGNYQERFSDYNYMVVQESGLFVATETHDPRDNAMGVSMASHTYHRNTHAIGVAAAAMQDATTSNFGPFPITQLLIEVLCSTTAALALKY